MKKVIRILLLNKEAHLYDTRLYIIKSFLAVLTAYALVQKLPLVHKDLISVLFGLMMTLEPVTITGIRSGFKQITATILGALVTAFIISVFGINIWTVAFSVSATLILCLRINWREVSPVAIFTSIYMTNYVQYNINGEPSVALTFQLRILSLGVGILIAVIYNFLFSLFFYKQMERKRITHSLITITEHLKQIKKGMEEGSMIPVYQVKELLPDTFKGIDWLFSLIKDKEIEANIKKKIKLPDKIAKTVLYYDVLIALRTITHLLYDTTYFLTYHKDNLKKNDLQTISSKLDELIQECDYVTTHFGKDMNKFIDQLKENQLLSSQDNRVVANLNGIKEMLDKINDTLFSIH